MARARAPAAPVRRYWLFQYFSLRLLLPGAPRSVFQVSYFQVIFKLFSVIFKLFSVVFKLFSSCFKLFSCYFQVVFKLFSSAFLRLPRCETMTAGVATQRRGPGNYRLFGNGQHIIHRGDAHTEYQSALVAVGLDRGMTAAEIADVPEVALDLMQKFSPRHLTPNLAFTSRCRFP
jgi:hypothetical protein